MSSHDFDRVLGAWLKDVAAPGSPDYLHEVLERTAQTRQRSEWLSLRRWLPMQTTVSFRPSTIPRVVGLLVVVGLVLALALAAIALVGSRPRLPAPFGVAGNGLIAFAVGGDVVVATADGSGRHVLPLGHPGLSSPTWSPTGGQLAAWSTPVENGPSDLVVSGADGSNAVVVATGLAVDLATAPSWAPDGSRLVFAFKDAWRDRIGIADVASRSVKQLGGDSLLRTSPSWSPDGQWIAFTAVPTTASWSYPALGVIKPDGTGERHLETSSGPNLRLAEGSSAWAPDPGHHRLLYSHGEDAKGDIAIYDLDADRELVVSSDPLNEFWPTWSPDGTKVAWYAVTWGDPPVGPANDGPSSILVATIADDGQAATGRAVLTASVGSCPSFGELAGRWLCHSPVWSPDGANLYGLDTSDDAIVLIAVDGSGHTTTIPLEGSAGGHPSWQRRAR
jgi:WD40 repeat protein